MYRFADPALALIVLAAVVALLAYTARWAATDARRRGRSPVLVTLALIFFFPWGLIAWLIFRPDPTDSGGPRGFRLEDHRVQ